MRPLTVADRPPQVGDVVVTRHNDTVRIDANGRPFTAQARIMPFLCGFWRYIHRKDGGPVTVEEK